MEPSQTSSSAFQGNGVIPRDLAAGVWRLQSPSLLVSLSLLVEKLFSGRQALLFFWQDRPIGRFFPVNKTFVLNEISREISSAVTF